MIRHSTLLIGGPRRWLSATATAAPSKRPFPFTTVGDGDGTQTQTQTTRNLGVRCHSCLSSSRSPSSFAPSPSSSLQSPSPSSSLSSQHHGRLSLSSFSTAKPKQKQKQEQHEDEEKSMSNRAAFRATPVIPSILAHIEKIGVGIRSKPKRRRKPRVSGRDARGGGGGRGRGGNNETLDEMEEFEYFNDNERRHRQRWQDTRDSDGSRDGNGAKIRRGRPQSTTTTTRTRPGAKNTNREEVPEDRGAHWLPPPPFSSFSKSENQQHDDIDNDNNNNDSQPSGARRRIIRRPVKLIGRASTLASNNLPRESAGLPEIAIAGRSNVGKSTLLNALLYGNIDENLTARKFVRGKTPEGAKLPAGVKAVASSKPGETKELSFYQLTADVWTEEENSFEQEKSKMSLLMVDLPGYGFAFAKEERTKEWKELMHHYLLERRSLKRILLLLDARHGFKKADWEFLGELQDGLLERRKEDDADGDGKTAAANKRQLPPIQIVLTKCDLVKRADLARRIVLARQMLSDFLIREPSSLMVMPVSARPGVGFNNVRNAGGRGGGGGEETPMGGVLELQRELASLVPTPRNHRRGR